MNKHSTFFSNSRLGFHYFPDTLHYREADLQTWLPVLQEFGARWLVLRSDIKRAIPEHFLHGLKEAGIEPLIQFSLSLERLPDLKEIGTLLDVYGRWGAHYAVFFDRPNARSAWPTVNWVQQDLVERFLDRFLPVANLSMQAGLAPVFPPLEPGGSYWDTAFLRSALQAIQRRKQDLLLQSLVLSAYGWTGENERCWLDWGAGGQARWPKTRPYHTPVGSQDQRSFRIFDWYLSIARDVLQEECPLILLQAGLPGSPEKISEEAAWSEEKGQSYATIARLMAGERVADSLVEGRDLQPVPASVIGSAFWLLGASAASPFAGQAWFQENGKKHPAVEAFRVWRRERAERERAEMAARRTNQHPIQHYLLLPGYEWGVSDWYLEVIRPFVKRHRPTVGFSPEEAAKADRVTVVGSASHYPDDMINFLEKSGCFVEQIAGDGTKIATELAER